MRTAFATLDDVLGIVDGRLVVKPQKVEARSPTEHRAADQSSPPL